MFQPGGGALTCRCVRIVLHLGAHAPDYMSLEAPTWVPMGA